MKQKKNKIFRFIFSLLPGAGEMYMGFMKMGVSLMTLFFALMVIFLFLRLESMIFICTVIWFYSFFNVHNIAGMPEEEFCMLEDKYLVHFDQLFLTNFTFKFKNKTIGIFLVILGFYMLLREIWMITSYLLPDEIVLMIDSIFYNSPRFLVGIGIIILGLYMIRGKKKQLDLLEDEAERNP